MSVMELVPGNGILIPQAFVLRIIGRFRQHLRLAAMA